MTPFRERNPFAVGAVSLIVIFTLIGFAFSLDRLTFLRGVYIIQADFADAAGLMPENEVRVAGLRVGKVRTVELAAAQDGDHLDRVRVTIELDGGTQLGQATTAEIKLKTLLGAKFVDMTPRGGEPFIDDGDLIPLERTMIPFEIHDVTDEVVARVGGIDAEALNQALTHLADVTEDPEGDLGRALAGLADATGALTEVEADLESLIREADTLTAALAGRSEELGRIIESGSRVLGALSQRREGLRGFVRHSDRVSGELADLVRTTRGSLDPALRDLDAVLQVVARNQGPLEESVRTIGPSAESFGRIFTQGTWGDIFTASVLGVPLPPDLSLDNIIAMLEDLLGGSL